MIFAVGVGRFWGYNSFLVAHVQETIERVAVGVFFVKRPGGTVVVSNKWFEIVGVSFNEEAQ